MFAFDDWAAPVTPFAVAALADDNFSATLTNDGRSLLAFSLTVLLELFALNDFFAVGTIFCPIEVVRRDFKIVAATLARFNHVVHLRHATAFFSGRA